jgi:hypothetical protein
MASMHANLARLIVDNINNDFYTDFYKKLINRDSTPQSLKGVIRYDYRNQVIWGDQILPIYYLAIWEIFGRPKQT